MTTPHDQNLDALISEYRVISSDGTGRTGGVTEIDTAQPYFEEDPDGDDHSLADGWELLTGFTGQYGYSGPAMHSSEYIGGGLERHIRRTPGLYTVLYGDQAWYIAHKPQED